MQTNLAAVYVRLSEQGEQEESIARQVADGTRAVKELGYSPVIFQEPKGVRSGYYEHRRPEWKRLKKELGENRFALVWVADLSRASRNRITVLQFLDWLQSIGVKFVSQKENFDFTTAGGKALLGVLAVFNQFYRDDISERKKRQYAARDRSIYASNRAPCGIERSGSYPNIVWKTNADFPVIVEICELYADGLGSPAIAKRLSQRGRKCAHVPRITESFVGRVIQNVDRYKPFLDSTLYKQVKEMYTRRHVKKNYAKKTKRPPLLLRGLIHCAHCGELLAASTNHQVKQWGAYDFRYYRHRANNSCPHGNKSFRAEIVDAQIWKHFDWLNHLSPQDLDNLAHEIAAPVSTPAPDYSSRRDKLMRQLARLVEMRSADEISQAEFIESRDRLRAELANIPESPPPAPVEYTFAEIRPLLDNLPETLRLSAEIDPAAANRSMLSFFERVDFDGLAITRVIWREPFGVLSR